MPVPPLNIVYSGKVGMIGPSTEDDDSYITSAYCDKDQVQWVYFRRVSRGFSDLEKVECEFCGGDLFVNEKRGSFVSSSITPEVVGWLKVGLNKTLDLVLTESSCEMLGEGLLDDILSHEFSGSISKVRLLQTPSASSRDLRRGISEPESSLKLIEQRAVISRKRRKRKLLRIKGDDLSESPFLPKKNLSEKSLAQMKKFLLNPTVDDIKWSTTKNLSDDSMSLDMLPTKSPMIRLSVPKSLGTWKPPARELKVTRSRSGTRKRKNTSTNGGTSSSVSN